MPDIIDDQTDSYTPTEEELTATTSELFHCSEQVFGEPRYRNIASTSIKSRAFKDERGGVHIGLKEEKIGIKDFESVFSVFIRDKNKELKDTGYSVDGDVNMDERTGNLKVEINLVTSKLTSPNDIERKRQEVLDLSSDSKAEIYCQDLAKVLAKMLPAVEKALRKIEAYESARRDEQDKLKEDLLNIEEPIETDESPYEIVTTHGKRRNGAVSIEVPSEVAQDATYILATNTYWHGRTISCGDFILKIPKGLPKQPKKRVQVDIESITATLYISGILTDISCYVGNEIESTNNIKKEVRIAYDGAVVEAAIDKGLMSSEKDPVMQLMTGKFRVFVDYITNPSRKVCYLELEEILEIKSAISGDFDIFDDDED